MLNAAAVWMTLANQADRDRARLKLHDAHGANTAERTVPPFP